MRIKSGYIVHKFSKNKFAICRIIKEYSEENEAIKDMSKLLSGQKTEQDLQDEGLKIANKKFNK